MTGIKKDLLEQEENQWNE